MTHGDPERGGRHGDVGLEIGREGLQPIFDFIERCGERPFFIWYAPFLPHTPHQPPDRLLVRYEDLPGELVRYYAMCEWFDETVGQLLDYLEKNRLAQDTLVVFLADNGWIQRTGHSTVPSGWRYAFAPRSKRSPYEGGIRTPVILRWRGKIQPKRVDVPVSSIDLAPTILAAAGLDSRPEMSGVNLLDRSAVGARAEVFGEVFAHDVMELTNPIHSLKYRWCVQGPWKLIVPHAPLVLDAPVQLYNLVSDPEETRNLALEQAELTQQLYQRLEHWWSVD
jgi:uncharacterized sulfatase